MSVTVRDALGIGGLRHSRLVAGRDGLDRVIGCVDILEVPDASLWLREHELLVTTCYAVRNDPEGQLNILRAMARSGSAALAVKFGRFVGEPPPAMLKLADELGIPLLDVPDGIPFLDITHPVMSAIVNRQAERLAYSEKVHRNLTQLALGQNGLPLLALELAQLLGRDVLIAGSGYELLAASDEAAANQADALLAALREDSCLRLLSLDHLVWNVFPVDVQQRRYGYILTAGGQGGQTDMQAVAVEHATTVAALQLAREEAVQEARHNYRRDFLEDLIAGAVTSRDSAIKRGEAIGLRLEEPYYIMVADIDGFTGVLARLKQQSELMARQIKGDLLRSVEQAAAVWKRRTMIVNRSDSFVIVLPLDNSLTPGDARHRLAALAEGIQARAGQRWSDITLTIGISRPGHDYLDFPVVYQHVRDMIRMVRRLYGKGKSVFWDEMEIYSLLSNASKPLAQFYEEILGAVDRPEIKNRQELLETLEEYLECQGNAVEAADHLFIHRNTLRYRLERLKELLGRGWDNPDYRFTLWMALKARRLLDKHP